MGRLVNIILRTWQKKVRKMSDSDIRKEKLVENGAHIGNDSKWFSNNIPIKRDCPLLYIGNNVTVAGEVSFLLHDNAIIKSNTGYTDIIGEIKIGDNCFIGYASIILGGVSLAPDTIVAAGSVVEKGIIIGGNPARKIGTAEDYFRKNKDKMLCLDGFLNDDIKKIVLEHPEKLVNRTNM